MLVIFLGKTNSLVEYEIKTEEKLIHTDTYRK